MSRKFVVPAVSAFLLAVLLSACAGGKNTKKVMTSEDYFQKAARQFELKKYEEARSSIEEARRRFRSGDLDARLLAMLGDIDYQMKEYNDAITAYGEFLSLHPRNPDAARIRYRIGMSYFNMIKSRDRDPAPAYQALENFNRLVADHPRSLEAKEAVRKIAETRRALAEGELFVAKFYLKKKCYEGAIGRFETVIEDYPDTGLEAEALYYLGEAYIRMEDEENAHKYFNILLERYPSSGYANEARDFLAERRG